MAAATAANLTRNGTVAAEEEECTIARYNGMCCVDRNSKEESVFAKKQGLDLIDLRRQLKLQCYKHWQPPRALKPQNDLRGQI